MGYVRLVRSGVRHCLANATCFIPDLKVIENFNTLLGDVELSNITRTTVQCLYGDIKNLVDNFEEATQYFKVKQ